MSINVIEKTLKPTFAKSGAELDTPPLIKCGYLYLAHATNEPGYDPPKAIQGPVNP